MKLNRLVLVASITLCWCLALPTHSLPVLSPDYHHSSAQDHLQSWRDWLVKRGGPSYSWSSLDSPKDNLQNWQDWISKRKPPSSQTHTDLSGLDSSKFQRWLDWISKRSGLSADFSHLDPTQLQQWSDWVAKRVLPVNLHSSFGSNVDLQNWIDFAKRQKAVPPSLDLTFSGSPYMQNWLQDWRHAIREEKRERSQAR